MGWPRSKTKPPNDTNLDLQVEDVIINWPREFWSTNQVTLGITAQSYSRVHIDNRVYDLDVGSGHPNGATAIKGSFVQRLKSYVIWVQTGVIQVGFYLLNISPSTKGQEK